MNMDSKYTKSRKNTNCDIETDLGVPANTNSIFSSKQNSHRGGGMFDAHHVNSSIDDSRVSNPVDIKDMFECLQAQNQTE